MAEGGERGDGCDAGEVLVELGGVEAGVRRETGFAGAHEECEGVFSCG